MAYLTEANKLTRNKINFKYPLIIIFTNQNNEPQTKFKHTPTTNKHNKGVIKGTIIKLASGDIKEILLVLYIKNGVIPIKIDNTTDKANIALFHFSFGKYNVKTSVIIGEI